MKDDPKEYYDEFGSKLINDFLGGNPRVETAIRFACGELREHRPTRVLDLGFGLGWSSYEYSRALSKEAVITGLDLSPKLTALAEELFGQIDQISFLCRDVCDPEWNHSCGQHDACVMLDVYEHVPRASRAGFHKALSSILHSDGLLILTCPSPSHQKYLRNSQPEGLQPVDEDVTFDDLIMLATDLGGTITHLSHESIWNTNDYLFVKITRGELPYRPRIQTQHSLIDRSERVRRIESIKNAFEDRVIRPLIAANAPPSLMRRCLNRLKSTISR